VILDQKASMTEVKLGREVEEGKKKRTRREMKLPKAQDISRC